MPGFLAALPAITAGAGILGKILGGGAKGAADNRNQQNQNIASQNMRDASVYGTQQAAASNLSALDERALMDRAQMGIAAPAARAKQALLASLIAGHRPTTVTAPAGIRQGTVTGGVMDGIGAGGKAAGAELLAQAMAALKSGSDIPEAANYRQSATIAPPKPMELEGPGAMESILSGGGLLGSIIGGLGQVVNQRRQPIPVDDYGEFGG